MLSLGHFIAFLYFLEGECHKMMKNKWYENELHSLWILLVIFQHEMNRGTFRENDSILCHDFE